MQVVGKYVVSSKLWGIRIPTLCGRCGLQLEEVTTGLRPRPITPYHNKVVSVSHNVYLTVGAVNLN